MRFQSAEGESVSGPPSSSSWSSSFTHRLCAASHCRWRSGHTGCRAWRQPGGSLSAPAAVAAAAAAAAASAAADQVKGCAVSLLQLNYTLLISSCRTQSDRGKKWEKNTNLKKNNRLNQENNLVTLGWKSLTRNVCRADCADAKQVHKSGPFLKCNN